MPVPVTRRVSDAERDAAVRLLGDALADGRISPDTFITRMDRTFASRDESSLDDVVSDLVDVQQVPGRPVGTWPRWRARRPSAPPRPGPGDVLVLGTTALTLLAASQDGPRPRRWSSRWAGPRLADRHPPAR